MSKHRVAIRTILYPEAPFITLRKKLNPIFKPLLVFEAYDTSKNTIEQWRKQIRHTIKNKKIRKKINQHLTNKFNSLGNHSKVTIYSHKAKQIFRYVDGLCEQHLILPYYSIKIIKEKTLEVNLEITHTIEIFPFSSIIVKTIATLSSKEIKPTKSVIIQNHKEYLEKVKTMLPMFLFKNNDANLPFLFEKTGHKFSYLRLKKLKKKTSDDTIQEITLDEKLNVENAFKIATNHSEPKEVVKKVEKVIDMYYAFRGGIDWIRTLVMKYNQWSLSEWVNYYSMVVYVFNPNSYVQTKNPIIVSYPLLKSKIYRSTWSFLFNKSENAKTIWNNIAISFIENIKNTNFVLLKKVFDNNFYQILNKVILLKKNEINVEHVFPKLSCKEATIFAIIMSVAKCFFDHCPENFSLVLIENKKEKLLQQFEWVKRKAVESSKNNKPFISLIDDIGWITTNFVKEIIFYFQKNKTYYPYEVFNAIPEKECQTPKFSPWNPNKDFSLTPGKHINNLINYKLVETQFGTDKQLKFRLNLKNPLNYELLFKLNKEK